MFVRSDNKFLTKLEKRGIRPIAGSMIDTAISVHLTTVGISYKTREMRRFGHHTNKGYVAYFSMRMRETALFLLPV